MNDKSSFQFTDELPSDDQYKPFSSLSVIVFLLALLFGVIALVNYKLVVLPLMGAILSLSMLYRLHKSPHLPQSHMFAIAALSISLFSFAFPVTYQTFRYRYLDSDRWRVKRLVER